MTTVTPRHRTQRRTSWFVKLLWFSAGAEGWLLKRPEARVDRNRYATYGGFVVLNTVLASSLWFYAAWIGFRSYSGAIGAGLLMGIIVYNLDRFLLKTIEKSPGEISGIKALGGLARAIPGTLLRVGVAGLLALLAAIPLVLRVCSDEIDAQLDRNVQVARDSLTEEVGRAYFPQISRWQAEIDSAQSRLARSTADAAVLDADVRGEADGTGGSRQRSIGSITQLKQTQADSAHAVVRRLQRTADSVNSVNSPKIARSTSTVSTVIAQRLKQRAARSLLARYHALLTIEATPEGRAAKYLDRVLTLVLLLLDVTPIFAKLLTEAGPYETLLRTVRQIGVVRAMDWGVQRTFRNARRHFQVLALTGILDQKASAALDHEFGLEPDRVPGDSETDTDNRQTRAGTNHHPPVSEETRRRLSVLQEVIHDGLISDVTAALFDEGTDEDERF